MSADSSDHDLKALWQDQTPETDPMQLEHIRTIGRRLDRAKQWFMIVSVAVLAGGFFIAGELWSRSEDPLTRVAAALYGVGLVGCVFLGYRLTHLKRDLAEPGGVFLRRQLQHSLQMSRGGGKVLVILAPLAPAFVALVALAARNVARMPHPPHSTALHVALQALPIVILAAAWLVTLLIIRPRSLRRLERDLDELNALMK